MRKAQKLVKAFHRKFNHLSPDQVTVPNRSQSRFRKSLIAEEAAELLEAYAKGDMFEIAHESVDLIVVVLGGMVNMGIDIQPLFNEVMRANMTKESTGPTSKPLKPEGWTKADVGGKIVQQMYRSNLRRWFHRLFP